jgi:hypothetical protein
MMTDRHLIAYALILALVVGTALAWLWYRRKVRRERAARHKHPF